jgi:serine O-acetyltransferase
MTKTKDRIASRLPTFHRVIRSPEARALHAEVRAKHPPFLKAVIADVRVNMAFRMERVEMSTTSDAVLHAIRLCWSSDAFLAQVLYRAKARLQQLGVPVLPRLFHHWAMATAQVCIGDPVVIQPGLYLAHGQVVIDGLVEIGTGVIIFPWVTIGLRSGDFHGATVGKNVRIGTGSKVVGPVKIGNGAQIGANAVVVHDVPKNVTVVGVPARVVNG